MKVQKDKLQHFAVCAIAALVSASIVGAMSENEFAGAAFGFAMAMGLGIGKEYGDSKAAGNKWCWWDILADALGAIVGVFAYFLLSKLVLKLLLLYVV